MSTWFMDDPNSNNESFFGSGGANDTKRKLKSVFLKNYSGYTKPIIFHTVISTYYYTVVDQSPMHSKIVSEMIQSS